MRQVISVLCILFGELFAIYAELTYSKHGGILVPAILMMIGGFLLLLGYRWGNIYLENIWVVYVVSITSILIIEPILIYSLGRESVGLGAKIGFACGVVGFVSAFLIK